MYRFLIQGGVSSPVTGAVTWVKLLGRNRNCKELPNVEAQQGQGCCSSMMPTGLTGTESVYSRHSAHTHTQMGLLADPRISPRADQHLPPTSALSAGHNSRCPTSSNNLWPHAPLTSWSSSVLFRITGSSSLSCPVMTSWAHGTLAPGPPPYT